jgi:hypothetical protein
LPLNSAVRYTMSMHLLLQSSAGLAGAAAHLVGQQACC